MEVSHVKYVFNIIQAEKPKKGASRCAGMVWRENIKYKSMDFLLDSLSLLNDPFELASEQSKLLINLF